MRPGAVIFDRISHLVSGSYKVTMGSDDGTDSELDKYAPKWVRERPAAPKRLRRHFDINTSLVRRGTSGPANKVFKARTRPGATSTAEG